MPGPDTNISTPHSFLHSRAVHSLTIDSSSNAIPTFYELLVTTSSDISKWKADGVIEQIFHSNNAGVVATAAITSNTQESELDMLAVADSQIILLVNLEDGIVRESCGLKNDEVIRHTNCIRPKRIRTK